MDFSAVRVEHDWEHDDLAPDRRAAPRYTSLIRAAKLISAQGEFVCVIRDVSSIGISIRTFHEVPICDRVGLELQNGEIFELDKVRVEGRDAGFLFSGAVDVGQLIRESWAYPKRQLRLNLALPLTVTTLEGRAKAVSQNLSQQGARIDCDALYAIDQTVRIAGEALPEIRAKVRWRKHDQYGLVFDNTFSLRDFAIMAARVQCPALLRGQAA